MAQTKIANRQISGGLDGWIPANETWTYASATSITVPSGATSKYQKGDKIKLTQTTVKYFYVIGVADTVLTVTGGSDYTLENATITSPYFSKVANPQDFPHWFNYVPTVSATGSMTTGSTTISYAKFSILGQMVHLQVSASTTLGGTASATIYVTPPVNCLQNFSVLTGNTYWNGVERVAAYVFFNNETNRISIRKYDWSSFSLGSGRDFYIGGGYPI